MSANHTRQEATRVTLVGMWVDLGLGFAKIIGGVITQSFALVTDGIHSFTDAVTDIFVLLVARLAHEDPDEEHPWGHGRFETLGTIAMGVVFFTTAGILLFDSQQRLRDSAAIPVPALSGVAIVLISIAAKEWIYRYTMGVARRLNSSLLRANAWHSRSDAISSIAVLIGIVAARQGYAWMDTVAAIFVALIIARIGWELCTDSLRELVDTAVPRQRRQRIEDCILAVDGILGITSLRSRLSGGKIILELKLLVDSRITVSEGHQLGENVNRSLMENFSDIRDVIVHIDPVQHSSPGTPDGLPERQEVIADIRTRWLGLLPEEDIGSISLHYLDDGIEVELIVTAEQVSEQLARQLNEAIHSLAYISSLRICKQLYPGRSNPPAA